MELKTKISNTPYAEEFEGLEDIFLLSNELSNEIWNNFIALEASSYFSLPDSNWLVNSKEASLGRWIDSYNNDDSEFVEKILTEKLDWKNDDTILYCISRKLVIESSWMNFKKFWMNFIECDDDCPIVINKRTERGALIFKPMGSVFFVEK